MPRLKYGGKKITAIFVFDVYLIFGNIIVQIENLLQIINEEF